MKRFLTNLILIISILSILVIPSFAATNSDGDDFVILKQPTDSFFEPSGSYCVVRLSIVAIGVNSYQWQVSYNGGETWSNLSSDNSRTPNFVHYYPVASVDSDFYFRCKLSTDQGIFYSRVVLVEREPTNIFNFVGSCLRYITSYISLITNSLITPGASFYALLPILCIGFAVAALLIVIKIIKASSWGM